MPTALVKLNPGVNTQATESLNEGGYAQSNLIRWMEGLPQKFGGWAKYFASPIGSIPRDLHAWQGIANDLHLGVAGTSFLGVLTSGTMQTITPQSNTRNPTVSLSTTASSTSVTINDTASNINTGDIIIFNTPVSVGGLIIQGAYTATAVNANSFIITSPVAATSTVTNGGAVASFTTTISQATISVTLANHGLSVGSSIAFIAPTTVGGLTIQGLYTVTAVSSSSVFSIAANSTATSSATASQNAGNLQYVEWVTLGAPATGTGYGLGGGWGQGAWGQGGTTTATTTGTPITTTDWTQDNFGKILMACPAGGPIFLWAPDLALQTGQVVVQAPTANGGIFIAMPQQILVAWGSSTYGVQDPLQVRWSDVGDYTTWTATSTNQAGSFRLPRGSKIVAGIQGPTVGLLWTDLALWSMSYISTPLVFGFNEIASGCGIIGSHAAGVLDNAVFWMGNGRFFMFADGGVQPVECTVWDWMFQRLDRNNAYKIRCAVNSQFGEVTWHFPSIFGGGENDSYVKFTPSQKAWDYGTGLPRSAWIDQSVLGNPIGASPTGFIYLHESGNDADGTAMNPSFQTGYVSISEGDQMTIIDQMWPDFKWGLNGGSQNATLKVTLYSVRYPDDPSPISYGPFTVTQAKRFITQRVRGRFIAMKVESSDLGSFWRLGGLRYRGAPDGKR